ncbi:LysE family translocator [Pseudonocardia sp. HH130630-07]|uniref:LysE family translocator n=1 Tax=Pseudonocardia sp. HH130630-07 TaxID=1690815 RepID=UPI000814D18F|nr:LysE family translocator [Pseudonocardia sp. HH130630-07]ANY07273.1 lysine transporter LysE [Pseudonocardia sp. HH130630-07]
MPTVPTLVTFMFASAVLIAVPGPSVLFIVGRALAHGRRAAIASSAGNCAGVLVLVVLVAAGLGPLVQGSATAFEVIKLVGAAYLVWLGVRTFRARDEMAGALTSATTATAATAAPAPSGRFVRQGFVVGLTNPKALVFFAAVLPQFVDPAAGSAPVQIAVLGLLFVTIGCLLDGMWGLAAGATRDWFATSPVRLRRVGAAGGLVLVGMGIGLAATGRQD